MEPSEIEGQMVELEGTGDSTPKPVYADPMAYAITAAGLAAYAETHDIRILVLLVILYMIGNFGMRITSQVLEHRKKG